MRFLEELLRRTERSIHKVADEVPDNQPILARPGACQPRGIRRPMWMAGRAQIRIGLEFPWGCHQPS